MRKSVAAVDEFRGRARDRRRDRAASPVSKVAGRHGLSHWTLARIDPPPRKIINTSTPHSCLNYYELNMNDFVDRIILPGIFDGFSRMPFTINYIIFNVLNGNNHSIHTKSCSVKIFRQIGSRIQLCPQCVRIRTDSAIFRKTPKRRTARLHTAAGPHCEAPAPPSAVTAPGESTEPGSPRATDSRRRRRCCW